MSVCICGHDATHHIYFEGACRPGFVCEEECVLFEAYVPSSEMWKNHFVLDYDGYPMVEMWVNGGYEELFQCSTCGALTRTPRVHGDWHETTA